MMKLILTSLFTLVVFFNVLAQKLDCGLSDATAVMIKQRLMQNRMLYTKQQVHDLMSNRTITYIPVSFHSVSNSSGQGAATEKEIFAFLCGLNALYIDQDIQFFIYNQIHFRVSDAIDDDASSNASSQTMDNWSIPGTMNITIGRSLSNQWASWYSWSDYIFLLKTMMTPQAKTEAHEVGHFFGLPHTFYGWEGESAESDYGGSNAPSLINGHPVEKVSRTSGANCTTAGDGFCGTEADYFSSRTACPYIVTVKDPVGASLDPDETNIMSYASDACISTFSYDQKAAIAVDVAQRTWVSNTPNGTTDLSLTSPSAISPLNNTQFGPISNPTLRLDWTGGAPWYYLEVYGTIIPNVWVPDVSDVIYRGYHYNGNSFYDLPTSNLQAGKFYVWRVTPISNYSTCASPSPYNKFEAVSSATSLKELPLEKQMSLQINSNPVTSSYISLSVYTAEDLVGTLRIYSSDGREVLSLSNEMLLQGESSVQLPASNLVNGVYLVVLTTERGLLKQKVIVQR